MFKNMNKKYVEVCFRAKRKNLLLSKSYTKCYFYQAIIAYH